jgi:hypothetical protein
MDANNVFVIITPLQNSNVILDWIFSIIGNGVISVIGGIFAAIISVYISIDYTVKKEDAIKFNKIMIKVIIEIKEIKRKMRNSFFADQIEIVKSKAKRRKNGEDVWVGFDKEEYLEAIISRYQYLPIYWQSIFFLQVCDFYGDENKKISNKIRLIKQMQKLSFEYNQQLQNIESEFDSKFKIYEYQLKCKDHRDNILSEEKSTILNPDKFDEIFQNYLDKVTKFHEDNKEKFVELINDINPDDEEQLLINVKFWDSIFSSFRSKK